VMVIVILFVSSTRGIYGQHSCGRICGSEPAAGQLVCGNHQGRRIEPMLRRRQVRLSYPQAFVELALLLALRHGRRNCARVLGLPLSTVYRWLEHYRRQPDRIERIERSDRAWLDELIGACEAHGFDLRERICTLEPFA